MPATVRLKYLGQVKTYAEELTNPEYRRYAKLMKKKPMDFTTEELQQFIKYGGNAPVEKTLTGREIAERDADGNLVRVYPRDQKGKPVDKVALNGRYRFHPENEYTESIPETDARKLISLKTSGGHDLYIEVEEKVKDMITELAELRAELSHLKKEEKKAKSE